MFESVTFIVFCVISTVLSYKFVSMSLDICLLTIVSLLVCTGDVEVSVVTHSTQ